LNNPRIDPVPVAETQRQKSASDDAWDTRAASVRLVLKWAVCLVIAVCSGGWFFFLGETESEDHARMLTLLRDIEADQFIEIEEGSNRVRKLAWKTLSFHPQEDEPCENYGFTYLKGLTLVD
jgi:hypothetical protein|tara:strand:- start:49 stop:414 length:366 start_codon:yes stop_codon:yes gene_type:complete